MTTSNNALIKVNPNGPETQAPITRDIPQYTAGLANDPDPTRDRKCIWFASPAGPQSIDPIYEFDVDEEEFRKHDLEPDALAQTVSAFTVKDPGSPDDKPTYSHYIAFAEPKYSYVGHILVGERPVTKHPLPRDDANFSTYLWSVAVSVSGDEYTYWATGRNRESRSKNGLYTYTPRRHGSKWERIELPHSGSPIHVITDSTCVWFGSINPNKLNRYEIKENSITYSEYTLPDEPRQLLKGPDNMIWVAGGGHIHRFRTNREVKYVDSVALLSGSEAEGLCLSPEQKDGNGKLIKNAEIWYTSPKSKKIGRYIVPAAPSFRLGKTQLVSQPTDTVAPGELVPVPMVASYVSNAEPTPGIPLTCRVVSSDPDNSTTAFADGTTECVIQTDTTGTGYFPPLRAGSTEEELELEISYSGTEEPTRAPLTVKQPDDN
ncbi:hypothetical protein ABZ851_15020 [Streptomyces sp. NPDC047049]|uniref:hypothetical protein n=1 Tax=Streptomyces sp. NPDC047049 TaxID=3156688 RepID=UPI00340E1B35